MAPISYVCRSYREKTRVYLPLPRLSWIGLKYFQIPFISDIETDILFLTSTCFYSNNSNIFKLARKENGDELTLLVKYSLITFPFNIFYLSKYVLFFFVDLHVVKQTLQNPPKKFWKINYIKWNKQLFCIQTYTKTIC